MPGIPDVFMAGMKLAGRYRLTAMIARGVLADFWQAQDEVLGRSVAAKILRPDLQADASIKRLFRVEALAAARLTHSNVVSVFDTGESQGAPFIVMEYLAGGNLRQLLARGPLDPAQTAALGADVCAALACAHHSGILHRNLRPENILFTETGHMKVGDFAISRAARAQSKVPSVDTYIAPEQLEGREPDARSDLYSLGAILFECLTGRPPEAIRATEGEEGAGPAASVKALSPDVPDGLDRAIARALEADPARRHQDAASFQRALRACFAGPAGTAAHSGAPAPRAIMDAPGSGLRRTAAPGAPRRPAPRHASGQTGRGRRKSESFLGTEGRWLLPAVFVILGAAAVVFGIPALRSGLGSAVAPVINKTPEPVAIVRTSVYDPPPGDGAENNDEVRFTTDGNPGTAWSTSLYRTADFGRLKRGVGIFIDLGRSRTLDSIEVTSATGGWQGTLRTSDDGRIWSPPGAPLTARREQSFKAQGSHRYWMIWITRLVISPGAGASSNRYGVAINQILPVPAP